LSLNPASNPRFFVIERLEATLQKLQRHDISGWALTGGIATELHLQAAGREISARPLNDVDFIVGSFDSIPASLGSDRSAGSAGLLLKNILKKKRKPAPKVSIELGREKFKNELNRNIHAQHRLSANCFQQHVRLSGFWRRQQ